jgi:predicted HD phosphohydrolase
MGLAKHSLGSLYGGLTRTAAVATIDTRAQTFRSIWLLKNLQQLSSNSPPRIYISQKEFSFAVFQLLQSQNEYF